MIECKICNKKFKALTNTHLNRHSITPKEYEEKFGCKTVPEGWSVGENNSFYGKKHIEGKSKVKTDRYRDNVSKRLSGKTYEEVWRDPKAIKKRKNTLRSIFLVDNPVHNISEEANTTRREKISKALIGKCVGEKHPNWKGGIAFKGYPSGWSEMLKESIRKRDNHKCIVCNKSSSGKKLHVHHIDYNKENLDPMNLVSMCNSCHTVTNNGNREKWTYLLSVIVGLRYGNQQPIPSNQANKVDGPVQRLTLEEALTNNRDTSAEHPIIYRMMI